MSRNFVSKIMAGTIALTPVSCIKKEPLHQITDKNIHPIIERVDSFAKSKANKISIDSLKEFAIDTVEISNNELNNQKIATTIQDMAQFRNPDVVVGSKIEYGYGLKMTGGVGWGMVHKNVTEPKMLPSSVVGVMENKVFSNPKENKYFVPVTYYGLPNPKLK